MDWNKLQAAQTTGPGHDGAMPNPCFCIGPQNGDPVCPCRMKALKVVNGRYVEIIDHGPAPETEK